MRGVRRTQQTSRHLGAVSRFVVEAIPHSLKVPSAGLAVLPGATQPDERGELSKRVVVLNRCGEDQLHAHGLGQQAYRKKRVAELKNKSMTMSMLTDAEKLEFQQLIKQQS